MRSPLRRDSANPILTADSFAPECVLVSNPGVASFDGALLMAVRVDHGRLGDPNIDGTTIAFASSRDDGATWTLDAVPAIDRDAALEILAPAEPYRDLAAELWRVYDPRLTTIELDGHRELALCLAVDTTHGLRPVLLTSRDARDWRCRHLGPPDDRNHALFPERVDGFWWRLTRPMHDYGGAALGAGRHQVWVQRSPDLEHWGHDRVLLTPDQLEPAPVKIGPGPPPVRSPAGWLCLTHLVSTEISPGRRGWEERWDKRYTVGAMMLDLDDPARLLAVAPAPLLEPTASYERSGYRDDVVFATGCHLRGDMLDVYYGAADTVVARASAPLDEVVAFVLSGRRCG